MSAAFIRSCALSLTLNKYYQILDSNGSKVKVFDDNGSVVWVDADCFRL